MEQKIVRLKSDNDNINPDYVYLENLIKDGWKPDPVWMPTGRPNIAEGMMIYHLIKYAPEEEKPAQPTDEIVSVVEVANAEGIQEEYYNKGYRIIPDKIYQKTSVMKLVKAPGGNPHTPIADNTPEDK